VKKLFPTAARFLAPVKTSRRTKSRAAYSSRLGLISPAFGLAAVQAKGSAENTWRTVSRTSSNIGFVWRFFAEW